MTHDDNTVLDHAAMLAAHQQQLEQVSRDISIIYKTVDGTPQKIEALDVRMSELISTLNDFMTELRKDYQTKSFCAYCHNDLNDKVKQLQMANGKLLIGIISSLLYVVYDVIKAVVLR
jgi:DNA repair ATPase RecN